MNVCPYPQPVYSAFAEAIHSSAVKAEMALATGFIQLGAGLSVGLAGLGAGFAIGIVGDAGVRGTAQQPRLFVGMVSQIPLYYASQDVETRHQILILIFAEVLGLYGRYLPSPFFVDVEIFNMDCRSHRRSDHEHESHGHRCECLRNDFVYR